MNINLLEIALVAVAVLVLVTVAGILVKRRPRNLDRTKFQSRWQDVQKLCKSKETWPLAVINADKLLDDALKQLRYKGKTMGERLVAAQRDISDNDGVWFGHKLRNKLVHEDLRKLKQRDVLDALQGFRDALRDFGAIK